MYKIRYSIVSTESFIHKYIFYTMLFLFIKIFRFKLRLIYKYVRIHQLKLLFLRHIDAFIGCKVTM